MEPTKQRRWLSTALYALSGVIVGVVLQALVWLPQVVIYASEAGQDSDQLHKAMAELWRWRLASHVAPWFALACGCGMAFWIGRKTAPKWYWGVTPAAPRLLPIIGLLLAFLQRFPAAHLSHLRLSGPTSHFVVHAVVRALVTIAIIAFAAYLGGLSRRRNGPPEGQDDDAAAEPISCP